MESYDILLIEDDGDLSEILERDLADEGYSVLAADNGVVAQDLMRNKKFGLIIADIRVPGRNGLQLAAMARSHPLHSKTPIMIISGHVDAMAAKKAMELKVVDVLVKPFATSEFVAKVKGYVKLKNQAARDSVLEECFQTGCQNFFDDYVGENEVVSRDGHESNWPNRSDMSAFILFQSSKFQGEIHLHMTKEVVHKIACSVFDCEDTPKDAEFLKGIATNIAERFKTYFVSQVKRSAQEVMISSPKIHVDYDEKHWSDYSIATICTETEGSNASFCATLQLKAFDSKKDLSTKKAG